MPTAVVTGCNSGIGHSFARVLISEQIDMLLDVAGTMAKHEHDSLETVNKDTLTRVFEINTCGPLLPLTQALLLNLRVGIVSSRVGSIADNSTGGIYAYRASKAAVNLINKSLAMDLKKKGIVVTLLHPGIVKTGLDPATANTPEAVLPEEAVTKLWKVWQSKGMEDTGKF